LELYNLYVVTFVSARKFFFVKSLRSKKVLSKGKYKNIFNWIFIALESSCTAKVKSMKEKTLTWSSSPNWLVVV